jgi:hypothetical protein
LENPSLAFLLFPFTFGLKSLSYHQLCVTFFLIGLEFYFFFNFLLIFLKLVNCGYDRPSNKYFKEGLYLKVEIKQISPLNLNSIVEASWFRFEFRVGGFVNIKIPFDLVVGEGLALDGLELIFLVVGLIVEVFILALTIFLFGLEFFWHSIKAILIGGGFRLADHYRRLFLC